MTSSTCRAIAYILLLAGLVVSAHAQSSSSKDSTGSISGKVSFNGEGVQGVVVTLRSNENVGNRQLTNLRSVTDAKGAFRIANVPPGNYLVTPAGAALVGEDDNNNERSVIVNQSENVENVDFTLIRGGVITGRVVDADGTPVIEEEIYVFSPRDPRLGSFRPAALTDDRGVYRVFALKPGNYTVAAGRNDILATGRRPNGNIYARTYYPGVSEQSQATTVKVSDGSEATNIDITFSRVLTPHSASGRVVDGATGEPIADASYGVIQIVSPTQRNSVSRGAVTNSRGEFKLENLVPGHYAVSVRSKEGAGDWQAEDVNFDITDRDVTGILIKTVKGASVSGVVVLEGNYDNVVREQFRDARLIVFVETEVSRRAGTQGVSQTLRPDGNFRIGGLPTGNATFALGISPRFRITRVERNGVIQPGNIEVKQGEDVTAIRILVGYGDASIRGALEVENGTFPPNGRFFVWSRRVSDGSALLNVAQVDARGQFLIENLLPGNYELIAGIFLDGSRGPLVQKKQEVSVVAGSATSTTIKLDLSPAKP